MRGAIPHRQANCALVDVTSVSVAWPIVTGIPMIAVRKRRTASDLFDFLFIFIFFFPLISRSNCSSKFRFCPDIVVG